VSVCLFYQFDGLGSTDRLTNALGIVTDNYAYKAFGIIIISSGTTTNPFTFAPHIGAYFETALYVFLWSSPYLPSIGRFLAHQSPYVFAKNNPADDKKPKTVTPQ
jgi:hypothetical protein